MGQFQEAHIHIGIPYDTLRCITNAGREHESPAIRNDRNIHQCLSLNLVFQVQSVRQAISVPATVRIDPQDLRP